MLVAGRLVLGRMTFILYEGHSSLQIPLLSRHHLSAKAIGFLASLLSAYQA